MKKLMTVASLLLLTIIVSAQTDFSGTWKLNKEKSKLNDQFSMAPTQLIIVQKGNDLSLERNISFQDQNMTIQEKFTLDGKECLNNGMMDSKKKSVAVFSDDKKVLTIDSKIPMQDGAEIAIKEVFSIVNGNLVIDSSNKSSWGDTTEKMTFDKQ
ncbi:MAG TPA: hypothetical protein PKV50_06275 [Prolixibacteraceae bacterium]|nr:hypothetical protein [Bacteroidales bacterium]HPB05066.1 hypothetical protein [Prolixibacteraceae bacterium]HQN93758.1 hypothetical protein [Prolixibacteraceae bacterium]HUM89120.1 hypothetical protein [Prolixibacteraceae bacterium]